MNIIWQFLIVCIFGIISSNIATKIAYRLFNEEQKDSKKINLFSKSICHSCQHQLKLKDIIPIISYFLLKRKCRYCNKKISIIYPFCELFLPLNFILSVYLCGGLNKTSIILCLLILCLTIQSIIDIRVMMSSDIIHIIEFILCIILAKNINISNKQMMTSIIFAFIFFMFISLIMKFKKHQDVLGFGDIKLFMILSSVFNLHELTIFITITGLIGIIFAYTRNILYKTNNNIFPFIPSIFLSFLLAFYFKINIIL